MKHITIAIGADHRGYTLKEYLKHECRIKNVSITWEDVGAYTDERSDYPEFARKVAERVHAKAVDFGVLLCGTGVGMAIAANRFKHVYAAVVWDKKIARLSREDDYANVLVLPADELSTEEVCECVKAWLEAEPRPGVYKDRVAMIDSI